MRTKCIDFELNGNIARIWLGKENLEAWWGDDWDDVPYECNAETVSPEYTVGHVDVAFPFDAIVSEPADGHCNSRWAKEDMQRRLIPMFVAIDYKDPYGHYRYDSCFEDAYRHPDAWILKMGDAYDTDMPGGGILPEWATVIGLVVNEEQNGEDGRDGQDDEYVF